MRTKNTKPCQSLALNSCIRLLVSKKSILLFKHIFYFIVIKTFLLLQVNDYNKCKHYNSSTVRLHLVAVIIVLVYMINNIL